VNAKKLNFENLESVGKTVSFFSAVFFSQHIWETTFHNEGNEPAMVFTSSFA